MAYLWWPILMGGAQGAGVNTFWQIVWNQKISVEQALWGGTLGAGLALGSQMIMKAWQNWLERQLLYQLAQFQKTRLYSDLLWLQKNSKLVTMYTSAAAAGAVLGAAVGIAASQTLFGQEGREKAIDFYTGQVSLKEWTDVVSGLQNKMNATIALLLENLHLNMTRDGYHDPVEFNYSYGMDPGQNNPSPSQDFPLGLGPGGTVV